MQISTREIGIVSRRYVAIGRICKSIVEVRTTIGMQHPQSASNREQHVPWIIAVVVVVEVVVVVTVVGV